VDPRPEPPGPPPRLVVPDADAALVRRLARFLPDWEVTDASPGPSDVLVVDVGRPGGCEAVRQRRQACPDALVAGYLAVPDRQRWEEAERAGADLVASRGSLARTLATLLGEVAGAGGRRRRAPLFDAGEVAGRLGLVRRVADSPVGPLAVFRCGAGLAAVEDRCPHAGASLAEGGYADGVVTCPAHGSQFDVQTGERVRGPADVGVRSYTVVAEGGRVWLLWAGTGGSPERRPLTERWRAGGPPPPAVRGSPP
jgi:nitrite reductase/ring-hydroxylating ferredoxin subunit